MWNVLPLGWLSGPLSKLFLWLCFIRQEKTMMCMWSRISLTLVLPDFIHLFCLGIYNTGCFSFGVDRWYWFLPLGCTQASGLGLKLHFSIYYITRQWTHCLLSLFLYQLLSLATVWTNHLNVHHFFVYHSISPTMPPLNGLVPRIRMYLWLAPGVAVCQSRLSSACWETIKVRDGLWRRVLLLDLSGSVTHLEWQLHTEDQEPRGFCLPSLSNVHASG